MKTNLFLMVLISILMYGYRLFSWPDILPLSPNDIWYMLGFTVEHMIFSMIHVVQRTTYTLGLTNWFAVELWEDGDGIVWISEHAIHFCITSLCMG